MSNDPMNERAHAAPDPQSSPALLEGWRAAFVNRARPYAVQQPDGAYRWVYEDCTDALLAAHLAGELALALSSTDARGWCRWACLDVDVPGSLPQLFGVRAALAELGLPGVVEGSRRGGHLWLFFDEPVPATAARYTVGEALAAALDAGVEVPTYELYPDTGAAGALGHAVRLPLGVHRRTGVRYPLYDGEGLPCVFSSPGKAAAFLLRAIPRAPAAFARGRWAAFIADGGAGRTPSAAARGERGSQDRGRPRGDALGGDPLGGRPRLAARPAGGLRPRERRAPRGPWVLGLVSFPRRPRARRAGAAGHALALPRARPALRLELALPLHQLRLQ